MRELPTGPRWTGPLEDCRRYRVEPAGVVGATTGGEGIVFDAVDKASGLRVALKVLTGVNVGEFGRVL